MPDDTRVTYDRIGYWIPIPWDNHSGRSTLCGDAAHPMTPHRGQGLNHAICDASNLIKLIQNVRDGEAKLSEAISGYDAEVVRRGEDEVIASKASCYQMLDWKQVMDSPIMKRGLEKGRIDEPAGAKPVEAKQDKANSAQAEPKLEEAKTLKADSVEAETNGTKLAETNGTKLAETNGIKLAETNGTKLVEPEPAKPANGRLVEAKAVEVN